jgi:hypothetical protein
MEACRVAERRKVYCSTGMTASPGHRWPALLAGLTALMVAGVVGGAHGALIEGLMYLLPALLMLLVLAARLYPGERALLAAIRAAPRSHRAAGSAPVPGRPRAALPRGGDLIASSLAVRPPPAPAPAFTG